MPLESTITNAIIKWLKSQPGCTAEKLMGSASSSGKADINASYKGRALRIEVKTPDHGNTPSLKQMLNLGRWYRANAIVMVAYSLDAVKELLMIVDTTIQTVDCELYASDQKSWVRFKKL